MEGTIVAALVAAGVSVASVAANLYISYGARRSAREGLELKARLDASLAAVNAIKDIEIEGERLRIRGWELVFRLERLKTQGDFSVEAFTQTCGDAVGSFARTVAIVS